MNTISNFTFRQVYHRSTLDQLLREALVAEKVCAVDRRGLKTIESPYGSQPTGKMQAIVGTYSTAAFTTTDDTLTVADEFVVAEHIFDFEETLTKFDVYASRINELNWEAARAIDKWVLNLTLEDGTGTYTTPVGGFTTAANINVIMSNLLSKVAGYADMHKGTYLVIESTDLPGFIQAQATNGFSFADAALNNGFFAHYMGVDIYVVLAGMFEDDSTTDDSGTKTWTNSGHRMFGVYKVNTYAAPQGIKIEEKMVAGKTGREVVVYGYVGAINWFPKKILTIDITIA